MTDLVGQRFGTRVVLAELGSRVKVICDCGSVDIVRAKRVGDACARCAASAERATAERAQVIASLESARKARRPKPVKAPAPKLTCPACGRAKSKGAAHCGRCMVMKPRPDAVIDDDTRYEHDAAAQLVVARHPDGATLELVGALMGVTRQRAEQLEAQALRHFAARCRLIGITPEDVREYLARKSGGSWTAWSASGEAAASGGES